MPVSLSLPLLLFLLLFVIEPYGVVVVILFTLFMLFTFDVVGVTSVSKFLLSPTCLMFDIIL